MWFESLIVMWFGWFYYKKIKRKMSSRMALNHWLPSIANASVGKAFQAGKGFLQGQPQVSGSIKTVT